MEGMTDEGGKEGEIDGKKMGTKEENKELLYLKPKKQNFWLQLQIIVFVVFTFAIEIHILRDRSRWCIARQKTFLISFK